MALTSRNYGGVEEGCVVNRRVLPASDNYKLCLGYTYTREPFWPSGKTLGWYAKGTSVRICFGSPFSSKVVVCGHCLMTLSLTIMKH